MKILAVDPGLVTGMAFWDTDKVKPETREVHYPWFGVQFRSLVNYADTVACEKYIMTSGVKTAQPEALMLMGVVEDQTRYYLNESVFWFTAKQTKKSVTDATLRKLGWYIKTKDGHANDAQRVLLTYLLFNHPDRYAELLEI